MEYKPLKLETYQGDGNKLDSIIQSVRGHLGSLQQGQVSQQKLLTEQARQTKLGVETEQMITKQQKDIDSEKMVDALLPERLRGFSLKTKEKIILDSEKDAKESVKTKQNQENKVKATYNAEQIKKAEEILGTTLSESPFSIEGALKQSEKTSGERLQEARVNSEKEISQIRADVNLIKNKAERDAKAIEKIDEKILQASAIRDKTIAKLSAGVDEETKEELLLELTEAISVIGTFQREKDKRTSKRKKTTKNEDPAGLFK